MQAITDSDQLVPPIRSAIERGQQAALRRQLEAFSAAQDTEIQRVCSAHYKEFIGSVQEVLKMKLDAVELRADAAGLGAGVAATGARGAGVARELQQLRTRRRNVDAALRALGECQAVAALAARTKRLVEGRRYYAALDAAEELDALLAHQLEASRAFTERVRCWLPMARRRVRNEVLVEFSTWLVHVKALQPKIGAAALYRYGGGGGRAVAEAEAAAAGDELAAFETLAERFAPVHRCLHVARQLGHERDFSQLYISNRSASAHVQALLPARGASQPGVGEWLPRVCRTLAGFFVVESVLASSLEAEGLPLLTTSELEQQWLSTVMRVSVSVAQFLQGCATGDGGDGAGGVDLDGYVRASEVLAQLCDALSSPPWGYNTAPLTKLLGRFLPALSGVLRRHVSARFREIMDREPFAPFSVPDEAAFREHVARYGLQDSSSAAGAGAATFPLMMPFSETVPAAWRLVEDTVRQVEVLATPMELSAAQLADALAGAADAAIAHVVAEFHTSLDNADLVIAQASQIAINAAFMADSAPSLRALVREKAAATAAARRPGGDDGDEDVEVERQESFRPPPSAAADAVRRTLDDVANRARDLIFELVRGKVDELMCPPQLAPAAMPLGPSPHVGDLTSYLQVTFMCITNLPHTVREAVHFASCAHIASSMLEALVDGGGTVNVLGLVGAGHDAHAMVEFANSCGVPQLADCFAQLSQLTGLLLSGNVEQILDDEVAATQFPLVDAEKLCAVLERFRDLGARAMLTGAGNGAPTLKRKVAEGVVRSLRGR